MMWPQKSRLKLQSLLRRKKNIRQLDDEIRFHLEQQIAENLAAGMSREEARHAAMRLFGNATVVKEETHDTWGWIRLEAILRMLRQSTRGLTRTPGFTLAAVLVIALGIGSTTALFTIVRSVLLKPLPLPEPQRLLHLYEHSTDYKFPYNMVAGGVFAEWKKQSQSFSDLAIEMDSAQYNLSGAGGQLPERVHAAECSWNLFSTLGVAPALGRGFSEADDRHGASGTVILSWGLWKRRFGGDPAILGQTIQLDAKPHTVVGVMPAWFTYPDHFVQLWTPVYFEEPVEEMTAPDSHDFVAVGRLKQGVTEEHARAELSVITRRVHDEHLDDPFISIAANTRPLLEGMVGNVKTPLYLLFAATGCLLLIACLNVAGLLVARGAARRRELAIRAALGGGRWRLLGEHLAESFVLSVAGGATGILLASGAIRWFVTTRQDMIRVEAIRLDGAVLVFATGLILLCALFSGLTSSFSFERGKIIESLQESSRSHTGGQGRVRLRKGLLASEVALTVLLLVGAGLLLKSYAQLRGTNVGCITKHVLTMQLSLPEAKYTQAAQRLSFYKTLLGRVRALPGVQAAGLVRDVPGGGYGGDSGFAIAEHPPLPQGKMQYAMVRWADPGYFAALGIPFLSGETFSEDGDPQERRQVVISAAFARQYFPNEDPIGKHLKTIGQQSFQIVGVVGDTRYNVAIPGSAGPMMYFSLYAPVYDGQVPPDSALAVRSTREVTSLGVPIQRIVQSLDPELAPSDILTMEQIIGNSTVTESFDATLLLAFAVLSLLLAAVGLFGVLSYVATQRTTEIGIRVALGAQRSEVLRLMLWDGLRPAILGLAIGLGGSVAAAQTVRGLLYGVHPLDAVVFLSVPIVLLCVAGGACFLPAWRASRLDPMQALRIE
jgi:predicted permease